MWNKNDIISTPIIEPILYKLKYDLLIFINIYYNLLDINKSFKKNSAIKMVNDII